MNRTMWLQECWMEKFCDVLGRYEAKLLTASATAVSAMPFPCPARKSTCQIGSERNSRRCR